QEQKSVRRVDDDGAGWFGAVIRDDLLLEFRIDFQARIDRLGLFGGLTARQNLGGRTRRRHWAAAVEQELDKAAAEISLGVGGGISGGLTLGRNRRRRGLRHDVGRGGRCGLGVAILGVPVLGVAMLGVALGRE